MVLITLECYFLYTDLAFPDWIICQLMSYIHKK